MARRDMSEEEISAAFDHLTELGMIVRYGEYAFMPTWFKHQNLDHPTKTKHRRPPREVIENYPDYVAGWERAFSTRDNPAMYPFGEESQSVQRRTTEDSLSTQGVLREESPNTRPQGKGREEKRKEGSERGVGPAGPAPPPPISDSGPAKIKDLRDLVAEYGQALVDEYLAKVEASEKSKGKAHADQVATAQLWLLQDRDKNKHRMPKAKSAKDRKCPVCQAMLAGGVCAACGYQTGDDIKANHDFYQANLKKRRAS
jgi:hypothetical protein